MKGDIIYRLYYILKQRAIVFFDKVIKRRGNKFVLMLHQIDNTGGEYSISKTNFKKMIEGKKFLTLKSFSFFEEKSYLLTFDDVDESVYDLAIGVLEEKDIPYYLFLCVEYINKEGYLNEKQIKRLLKNKNCHIGSHLLHHKLARKMQKEELVKELSDSKRYLEETFGIQVDSVAFPYGSMYACGDDEFNLAKKYYKYIFTTVPTPCRNEHFERNVMPRININNKTFTRREIQ